MVTGEACLAGGGVLAGWRGPRGRRAGGGDIAGGGAVRVVSAPACLLLLPLLLCVSPVGAAAGGLNFAVAFCRDGDGDGDGDGGLGAARLGATLELLVLLLGLSPVAPLLLLPLV